MCLINSGIASGNMMMGSQKTMIDQFYRTASGQGGFFGPNKGVNPSAFQFKSGSSSDGKSFSEDEDEEEEEEQKVANSGRGKRLDDSF